MAPLTTSLCFSKCLLAAMLFLSGVSAQDTTTQTIQGSVYASPGMLMQQREYGTSYR